MSDGRLVSLIEDIDRKIRLFQGMSTGKDFQHLERLVHDRDRLHRELRRLRGGGAP